MDEKTLGSLSNDDLLLFYNCLNETLHYLDHPSQFHSRVGITSEYAEQIRIMLGNEIDLRPMR